MFSGEKVDYRSGTVKPKALEVPPDLTQLSRESRYQLQGGVVSASGAAVAPAAPTTAGAATVALSTQGVARVERAGQHRWLVVKMTPEQLWPRLRGFWEQRGFTLETDDAATGVMETNWSENRAKLPQDIVRRTLGRLIEGLYDTGERDRFRTRIERTEAGVEVYVSHRGAVEDYVDQRRESTAWRMRPADPQLEAEMLSRLMLALGEAEAPARAAVAGAPEQPARARLVTGASVLEVDEPFDRTWRRVGLALDRGGFTVEDRDRAGGVYFVRYVDPKSAGKEEPGFWSRLMGETNTQAPVRYRIAVKSADGKTTVSVLSSAGAAETSENSKRIAQQLLAELR
ncbi:MAG: outer membrane protein assembly factor BamC [Rubrivivax sp.]|nr:outer membrane protein assembly factor BamC [Rubrivivax sp.]